MADKSETKDSNTYIDALDKMIFKTKQLIDCVHELKDLLNADS